jgi:hypothetical protein
MGRLNKFVSMTRREKQVFLEALFVLLLSNLSIKAIPFRLIHGFLQTHWGGLGAGALVQAQDIRLVALSLSRAANQFPWKILCLSRSIAAYVMLRRRGIPAVIFTGVKVDNTSLLAHAWVEAGPIVIDVNHQKSIFVRLMSIPPELPDS